MNKKINIVYIILITIAISLTLRAIYLQTFYKKNILKGLNIAIKQEDILPERGCIFDNKGKLLVYNQYKYEIELNPYNVKYYFNINDLCRLTDIDKKFFYNQIKNIIQSSEDDSYKFISHVPQEKYTLLQEQISLYPAFKTQKNIFRAYNIKSMYNVIGYIKHIDKKYINRYNNIYKINDTVGISGVEKYYEKYLKGKKGSNFWIKNMKGFITNTYHKHHYNIIPYKGENIYLSIDWKIQNYIEKLMYKKKGSIIVSNPNNGEIVAIISSPILDINLFINYNYQDIINNIVNNKDNIFLNKPIQGIYPPGSPFKILTELAGLEMNVVSPTTIFTCHHGFKYKNMQINCHCGLYFQQINLEQAIAKSCNNYFAQVYKKIIEKYPKNPNKSIDEWCDIIKSFGLGVYINNDLAIPHKGYIPNSSFYNKKYHNKWNALTIISNSIGQGEIIVTPMQLIHFISAIANKGFFYPSHVIKNSDNNILINKYFKKKRVTKIHELYFNNVIDGMKQVFLIGTARRFNITNLDLAGKTGTSQNFFIKNKKQIALKDHSIFILFGPVQSPKISIVVIIENGGYGSTLATPISTLIAEKYLKKYISQKKIEQYIINYNLESIYTQIANMCHKNEN